MTTKKWNGHLSVKLTSIIIKAMFAVFVLSLFGMPYYAKFMSYVLSGKEFVPFLTTFYFCAVFAFIALFNLNKLINNIKAEKIVRKRKPAPKNDADFLNLNYTAFFKHARAIRTSLKSLYFFDIFTLYLISGNFVLSMSIVTSVALRPASSLSNDNITVFI